MGFSSFILATAAASSSISPALEQDLQCLATYSVVAGLNKNKENEATLALGAFYYMGKIDVRGDQIDLGKELRRIWTSADYANLYKSQFDRCIAEVQSQGRRMVEISNQSKV